jgi:hypothetical protein
MKRMKKIIIALLPLLLMASCKKDLTSINIDPKSPTSVTAESLFTGSEKNLADLKSDSQVGVNIFRLIVQYWTETTYTDESNFDLVTRNLPASAWNGLYRDVIRNLREVKALVPTESVGTSPQEIAAVKKNRLAQAEILEIYTWYYLVTTFGNVPYSQALDINNPSPAYDDQKTIYYDLLKRMDAAIGNIDENYHGFISGDAIYAGDMTKWKKFANSFKLKMGMTIADYDNTKAQSVVESAVAGGVFASNDDNASFKYLATPPNTNPVWANIVQSGRKDYVVTNTIVNMLNTVNDPRRGVYFTIQGGGYSGGIPGASNNYNSYSKVGDLLTQPTFPGTLLGYDEVEFFLAEALMRNYNVGGTASQHYNNAITANFLYWGLSTSDATTYLSQPSVAFDAANWKQSIGNQKWIALYDRGWDEWIEWRRLDYPQLVTPPTALSVIPLRYTYPIAEQNVNTSNYNTAASAIGGDVVATKLFWDKF